MLKSFSTIIAAAAFLPNIAATIAAAAIIA